MAQTALAPPAKWALGALAMAGVGISAFWLAKAALIWASPESEWVAPLPVTPAYTQQATAPRLDVNFDAFHRAPDVEVVDTNIGEDAPETTLNLVLVGQRSGPDGSAYIRTPDRRRALFQKSDLRGLGSLVGEEQVQLFSDDGILRGRTQAKRVEAGEVGCILPCENGPKPRLPRDQGGDLGLELIPPGQRGGLTQGHDDGSGFHEIALADIDGLNDAAFEVLHDLAVVLDDDLAACRDAFLQGDKA